MSQNPVPHQPDAPTAGGTGSAPAPTTDGTASAPAPTTDGTASAPVPAAAEAVIEIERSEEHKSELQSRGKLVSRLLLEKKKERMLANTESSSIKMTANIMV